MARGEGSAETEGLLAGTRVVDLAGEPAAMAGRLLADLGAEVLLPETPEGHPLRAEPHRFAAWAAGKVSVPVAGPDDPALAALLATADAVVDTPGFAGAWTLDPALAPDAVWVSVTPFGLDGPRSDWRASDLGVMASSGNMYSTGDPDRAPVRATEPSGYAHVGAETAFATLTGLASGRPQRVDVSMQEVVMIASMATPARFPATGFRGRRLGANIGRTREIWPTKDGFVSFGLRGGKARIPTLNRITELVDTPALRAMDWTEYSPNTADEDDAPSHRGRHRRLLRDQDDAGALRRGLRDEPHARPDQLAARDPRQRAARGPRLLRPAR